jgi:hypothetical protein
MSTPQSEIARRTAFPGRRSKKGKSRPYITDPRLESVKKKSKMNRRQLKKRVLDLLQVENFSEGLQKIRQLPPRRSVNPLMACLCSLDERIKWRAVAALGEVVADLAAVDLESARIVMRRFIWNLNDESGGIGWGCPEAMAAAMAHNDRLAEEYSGILVSYIQPEGNYLEHAALQRGVLWGVGRLAHARPDLMRDAAPFLLAYLRSDDPKLRGLGVWAIGPLANCEILPDIQRLAHDPTGLTLYRKGRIEPTSVGRLARETLAGLSAHSEAGQMAGNLSKGVYP